MQMTGNKNYEKIHWQKVQNLISKIDSADAILVGAAAGMSAACGFIFFTRMMKCFGSIWGISMKNMDLLGRLMVFIIIIHHHQPAGLFLRV